MSLGVAQRKTVIVTSMTKNPEGGRRLWVMSSPLFVSPFGHDLEKSRLSGLPTHYPSHCVSRVQVRLSLSWLQFWLQSTARLT